MRFFIPPRNPALSSGILSLRWIQFREQILTGLLRVTAVLSIPAALVSIGPVTELGIPWLGSFYIICVSILWYMAIQRSIRYHIRAGVLLSSIYLLAISEMINFGYTEDSYGYFVAFALFSLILFGNRFGLFALLMSVLTLLVFGLALISNLLIPAALTVRLLRLDMVIATCFLFLAIVGGLQIGIATLFRGIELAWLEAHQAREELEQRVAERTHELALAHQEALELSHYRTEQNQFLAGLTQTTLELLRSHDRDTILQLIVERAAELLDAPYGQLLLLEEETLVVQSATTNLAFLPGYQASRQEAIISWRAIETGNSVIKNDCKNWPLHPTIYGSVRLQAVASFPISIEQRCIGALSLGRTTVGHGFTEETIQKGNLLSQLIAVVLQNRELYTTALNEIRIRRDTEEQLRNQNADLDAFAHTVAHDLKNPLSAMLGNTQLLQIAHQDMPATELEHNLAAIMNAGMKMNTIIEALLMLSSVRLQEQVQHSTIDMESIVADVLFRLDQQIRHSHATIHLPNHWPISYGYGPWIEEIWINYLSNAIKYGGTPPIITITAEQLDDGMVRFGVHDNGPGISAEQQALLFVPFTRLRPNDIQGHGLGLSIVQRITSKLNGTVSVASTPGQGSSFFFTLPTSLIAIINNNATDLSNYHPNHG